MKIESFFEVIENLLNSTKKGKLNWGLSSNANQLLTEFNLSDLTLTKDINELDDYIKFTFYFCAGPDSNFTFNVVKDIDYGDSEEISINFQDEFGEIVDEHFPDRPDYIWECLAKFRTPYRRQL
ncbi:MAG: hypothetical protein HOG34_22270 [Bacteroidetes bacterium]|nr:hypothetical protein [Bacteroidota bacterium]